MSGIERFSYTFDQLREFKEATAKSKWYIKAIN